jgi:micrococcal nuclease
MDRSRWLKSLFRVFCIGVADTALDNNKMKEPKVNYVKTAKLVKVVDGDTLRVVIDLGWNVKLQADVRLSRVNTPESRGYEREAGKYVTQQVIGWITSRQLVDPKIIIHSVDFSSGKFGRAIAEVWVNGECLNDYLLEKKLAWEVDKNGKQSGLRDIMSLDIPDAIREQFGK